jgi:serine beta-lactamase-like protein LACTB
MNELSRHHVSRGASRRGFFVLATVLFFVLRTSPAEAGEGKLPPEQRRQLETVISRFMAANSVPGISAAAVVDGQEAWSEGFGRADLENNVPVTPQTLFRLGSVSKSITATATMHLWEQGKLDLDAPLQQYCPQFPKKEWPISTRQILGHLGGIRHYRSESEDDLEINNTKHFDDPIAGGIQFFANDPLVAKPGTKFRYSTQGFTLVGCAIEGASREKYVDYVEQNVLRPAGMSESRWDDRYAIVPHRTRFYSKSKSGSVVNADFLDSSYKIPGGGWLSSADDMAKFEVAVLEDQLMKRSTRDLMWTPQHPSDPPAPGERTGYALGWGTGEIEGVRFVGHGGGQQGTSTFIMIVPEQRIGVVVLANMDQVDASGLATDLMKILVKRTR